MYKFSKRSKKNLAGLHPDLVKLMQYSIRHSAIDFAIIEGVRPITRQARLVASKASTTMNSRHLTGHAVDVACFFDGKISWHFGHYNHLAQMIKKFASDLGIAIQWGGDWQNIKDGVHYQLAWQEYPIMQD